MPERSDGESPPSSSTIAFTLLAYFLLLRGQNNGLGVRVGAKLLSIV